MLINSRGVLLPPDLIRIQVEAFANDFIINIGNEQRRRCALFATLVERNFFVSALKTSAIRVVSATFNMTMKTTVCALNMKIVAVIVTIFCFCDIKYICQTPLAVCDNSFYQSDYLKLLSLYDQLETRLITVKGFQSGCLPLNSLLLSTLECYHDQSYLSSITCYLLSVNILFNILDRNVLNRSIPTTTIEQRPTKIDYSPYFAACRPLSCSHSYKERFSVLYSVTTLIEVFRGFIAILRFLYLQLTNILCQIQNYILMKVKNNLAGFFTTRYKM